MECENHNRIYKGLSDAKPNTLFIYTLGFLRNRHHAQLSVSKCGVEEEVINVKNKNVISYKP